MANRRNPKAGILRWLEQSSQPIYVLDDQRRVVFANGAALSWLGATQEQLIGLACDYHSRSDADLPHRIAASLCPSPETFEGQASRALVGGFLLAAESKEFAPARIAHFLPVSDEAKSFVVFAFVDAQLVIESKSLPRDALATRSADLHQELIRWRRETASLYRLDRILGVSDAMRNVQRTARAAITSGADTLIIGPHGAGMESLARAIHYSQFPNGPPTPLVPLDCAIGDPESLHAALRHLQSDRDRTAKGRLLLLRADLMNTELMRELAEFVLMPNFDVGILSTGEASLRELAEQQKFDRELALHLSTLEIRMPPLRARVQDLPLLCQSIVEDFNAEGNQQLSGLQADTLELLYQYPWHGNLDELTQVVHAACHAAIEPTIRPADLPKGIQQGIAADRFARPPEPDIDLPSFLKEVEDELMRRALQNAKGNKTKAARLLGISRQRMIRWSELHSAK